MGLESRLVFINLVEPYSIGFRGILDNIKPQTAGFIVYRTTSIIDYLLDESFFGPRFDFVWARL